MLKCKNCDIKSNKFSVISFLFTLAFESEILFVRNTNFNSFNFVKNFVENVEYSLRFCKIPPKFKKITILLDKKQRLFHIFHRLLTLFIQLFV